MGPAPARLRRRPAAGDHVYDAGEFVARVDFLLGRVVIEFDGMATYDDVSVLRAEKRREDALRSLGYQVVRITWADLSDLPALRRRIDAALGRAAA